MTRIDFYLLEDQTRDACLRFACRLCLKGLQSATPVHIHADDEAQAEAIDELMWDYPKHRFLPHEKVVGEEAGNSPIHIGTQPPALTEGLLINLASTVPDFFGRFDRVAEIVVGETRVEGRVRYKHYRDRGYPLHHHELQGWENAS